MTSSKRTLQQAQTTLDIHTHVMNTITTTSTNSISDGYNLQKAINFFIRNNILS